MLFISKVAFGQSDESYKNEFGVNIASLLPYSPGWPRYCNIVTYKRAMENCFLRSSISVPIKNRSFGGDASNVEVLLGSKTYLPINCQSVELPNDSLLSHANTFLKSSNYTLKAGLESRIKEGKFIIFYGMDLSLGLIRGKGCYAQSVIIGNPYKCGFENYFIGAEFDAKEQYYFSYGALPFLGVKWPLGKRLFLNAEFLLIFF